MPIFNQRTLEYLGGLLGGMPITKALLGEAPPSKGFGAGLLSMPVFDAEQGAKDAYGAGLNLMGVIKKVGNIANYQGPHGPAPKDYGAPLHDLTKLYPDDVYSAAGQRYYASTGNPGEISDFYKATSYRGKPDATVNIYRAVPYEQTAAEKISSLEKGMAAIQKRGIAPDGSKGREASEWYNKAWEEMQALKKLPPKEAEVFDINPGDWVAISREYAKNHGESALGGKYKIVSKKVKAKELFNSADSIQEYGWWPE